jgi:hypothetical protein
MSIMRDTKESENTEISDEADKEKKKYQPSNKTVKFWGDEFQDEPENYKFLDDEYTSWVIRANNGEAPSKALESKLKEMCKIQLDLKKARKSGGTPKDLTTLYNSYNKLAESAGLNPNQEDSTNLAERNALGVLIDV